MPDGTTQMDVCTENTDVREVGFHPPVHIIGIVNVEFVFWQGNDGSRQNYILITQERLSLLWS